MKIGQKVIITNVSHHYQPKHLNMFGVFMGRNVRENTPINLIQLECGDKDWFYDYEFEIYDFKYHIKKELERNV